MADWVDKGGVFIYPLILCSIISLTLFLERLWALRRSSVLPRQLGETLSGIIKSGDVKQLQSVCSQNSNTFTKIIASLLPHVGNSRDELKERLNEYGKREIAEMERFLGALETIAAICPLLGLLGTVSGMMGVFTTLSQEGTTDPSMLANNISEALITTAAGLIIAIPTFVGYKYLNGKISHYAIELEEKSLGVIDSMTKAKP